MSLHQQGTAPGLAEPEGQLAALQARMQAHVLVGDQAAFQDVVDGGGRGAAQRLGIYHHAYRARLLETLRDSFGHTLSYLGDEWFDMLGGEFIECHPSTSRNLRWYGEGLAEWLDQRLHADSALGAHPEVSELAKLDWALRRAFDGPDAPALGVQDLAALAPQDWATVAFVLHPTVALMSLRCNTLALWHALDQGGEVPLAEALPGPLSVLVWRRDERPHFRSVAPLEALGVQALMRGESFAEMCALVAGQQASDQNEGDPAARAGALLRHWLDEGLLSSWACGTGLD